MQARVDWVLIIFGTQVIKKIRPVWPVFPDYLSLSYDYDFHYITFFSFNQNKFVFSKKQFYHIPIFFHSSKIYILSYEFFIEYFSGEDIWSSTCIYKSQNFTFSM